MVACEEVARENTQEGEGEGEGTEFVGLGKIASCVAVAV
jgi:hypothetical protein